MKSIVSNCNFYAARLMIHCYWFCSPTMIAFAQENQQIDSAPINVSDRPFLGAFIKSIDDEQSRQLGVTATTGAVVTKTTKRSPAEIGGLFPGDVIQMLNGETIENPSQFYRIFNRFQAGRIIKLTIQRYGETKSLEIAITSTKSLIGSPNLPVTPSQPSLDSQGHSIVYQHPEKIYRIPLLTGWKVDYGMRGKIKDPDHDTLHDETWENGIICYRKITAPTHHADPLDEFRVNQLSALGSLRDVNATGFTLNERPWVIVSYVLPESGQWIGRLATLKDKHQIIQFDFISSVHSDPATYPESMNQFQNSITIESQIDLPKPDVPNMPIDSLVKNAERLTRIIDGRPRVVGLNAASTDRPEAIALGIDSFTGGAVVTRVYENTPAAQAGMRRGDLILQFGEQTIKTFEDCQAAIWTAPLNSVQRLAAVRGQQQMAFNLRIAPDTTNRLLLQQYRHSSGAYQFEFFPGWKRHPNVRREEVTGRVFDYLESKDDHYRLHVYHDHQLALDPAQALEAFVQQTSEYFLEGKSGWLFLGEYPGAFTSGVVGRERLFTLYRMAFVIQQKQYEMDIFSPPINDPAELPFVVRAILGGLRE